MLADRIRGIGFSPTLRLSDKAKTMRAEGIDVIDLSVGEPDFPTPENVKDAAKRAIDDNFTKYTATDGIVDLRDTIIRRIREDLHVEYDRDELIVSAGAKNSLFNMALALFNPGEECIVPAPYWVSYPEMIKLARGVPVYVQTTEENNFLMTPRDLKLAITANTKALILCNPCNPTGMAYPREELEALVHTAIEEGIVIIADEIYSKLVYDGFRHTSVVQLGPHVKENTILINGVSKAYSMTGWRIGYAAGPKDLIGGMGKLQSHSTSNASSISQKAAVEAFGGPQQEVNRMVAEFQRRRNAGLRKLLEIPGVTCNEPQGAFYLFPNISVYLDREYHGQPIRNSYGLSYYLLKEAHVAALPGESCGLDGYLRVSYACELERLEEGISRIHDALLRLNVATAATSFVLKNTLTKVRDYVHLSESIDQNKQDLLTGQAEGTLKYAGYHEWNANIGGAIIQLRTNSPHLIDFWQQNFFPAPLEAEIEPHGIVYAVKGVKDREPKAWYDPSCRTAYLFNSSFYAQLRTIALAMAADINEALGETHGVRGMSVSLPQGGALLMGPPGTKKSAILARLLSRKGARLHSPDYMLLRYADHEALAEVVERKFYLPTELTKFMPRLAELFELCHCENIVEREEGIGFEEALDAAGIEDTGQAWLFQGHKGRAMLDPYWLGGRERHARRTKIRVVGILTNDKVSPVERPLTRDEALLILEQGLTPLASGAYLEGGAIPFYNRHRTFKTRERVETQRRLFGRLLDCAKVSLYNAGVAEPERISSLLAEKLKG